MNDAICSRPPTRVSWRVAGGTGDCDKAPPPDTKADAPAFPVAVAKLQIALVMLTISSLGGKDTPSVSSLHCIIDAILQGSAGSLSAASDSTHYPRSQRVDGSRDQSKDPHPVQAEQAEGWEEDFLPQYGQVRSRSARTRVHLTDAGIKRWQMLGFSALKLLR